MTTGQLSMAAVFYNTRIAPVLSFVLPIVHFLPGRIDQSVTTHAERER